MENCNSHPNSKTQERTRLQAEKFPRPIALLSILGKLDSVAIGVSSRPKLTGIVPGKAFLHVFTQTSDRLAPDSRKCTYNAKCDGYDRERY
ncbi:hypothetical protein TNCV_1294571 [Trichonephila clavipes]|nr:hypothetical protein TNCV_1294571 [Trichonephila clavipes]